MVFEQLKQIISCQPLIIGIGNDLRGDDGAGIILVEKIRSAGYQPTLTVGGNPENYLQKIMALPGENRLWIDAINWGASAGEIRIFNPEEINHFAISTHNFSLAIISKFLNEYRPLPDFYLGIQPDKIELGEGLSVPVQNTVDKLAELITGHLSLRL